MRETKFTCDKCKLSIEPLDPAFKTHNVAAAGSLVTLARVSGGMYHNQVPHEGWDFHYLCFSEVVTAIAKVCDG